MNSGLNIHHTTEWIYYSETHWRRSQLIQLKGESLQCFSTCVCTGTYHSTTDPLPRAHGSLEENVDDRGSALCNKQEHCQREVLKHSISPE